MDKNPECMEAQCKHMDKKMGEELIFPIDYTPVKSKNRVITPGMKTFTCKQPNCQRLFTDFFAFKRHLMDHKERGYECKYKDCGKKFTDRSKLKRHQLVHTGLKEFKCTLCSKCFSLDFNLKTHMRIHSGVKPYKCKVFGCNRKFAQSSNLISHQRTNHNIYR